jgi:ketopantoate reductase
MRAGMRALVVGAGAVGQVYGRHLQAGGASVAFLVKPKHAAELRGGLTLYALNRPRRQRVQPEVVTGIDVLTSVAEVGQHSWDQVYLTISSTALRAGTWFAELAPALGDATVVLLQPGPTDRAFVLQHVPADRLVQGTITVVSYHAPLPGEQRFARPGVAYWFGPFTKSPMSGPSGRLRPVVAALQRGGLPARRHRDVARAAPFPTAALIPALAVLEESGWSIERLLAAGLPRAGRAGREALAVTARQHHTSAPWPLRLVLTRVGLRALLTLAPRLMPLDLETYLRVHFTKVGDQTRDMLRHYIDGGQAAGLPVETLTAVTSRL